MAADNATGGYWLVAADGGIFSYGAPFEGSTGSMVLNKPIVGMEAASDGSGYRFVASDGGLFSFGLPFEGSEGSTPLNQPVGRHGARRDHGLLDDRPRRGHLLHLRQRAVLRGSGA